jgi:transcriptional regulator
VYYTIKEVKNMANFSERLTKLRMEKHLTQEKFANILGVSKSTVSMYENGNRTPSFEIEEKIADYFNVDLEFLRGRSETRNLYQNNQKKLSKIRIKDLVNKIKKATAEKEMSSNELKDKLKLDTVISEDSSYEDIITAAKFFGIDFIENPNLLSSRNSPIHVLEFEKWIHEKVKNKNKEEIDKLKNIIESIIENI